MRKVYIVIGQKCMQWLFWKLQLNTKTQHFQPLHFHGVPPLLEPFPYLYFLSTASVFLCMLFLSNFLSSYFVSPPFLPSLHRSLFTHFIHSPILYSPFFIITLLCPFELTLSSPFSFSFCPIFLFPQHYISLHLSSRFFAFLSVFCSVPGPVGWWFPLSRWPTLIIYWWQENRGRPSQLLLPGTPLGACTHTYTFSHNDSQICMQLLEQTRTHLNTNACREKKMLPSSLLRCHTFLHCSLLLSSVILCCTFAPLPPSTSLFLPPALLLSPPAVVLLTLSHRNRQKERWGREGRGWE